MVKKVTQTGIVSVFNVLKITGDLPKGLKTYWKFNVATTHYLKDLKRLKSRKIYLHYQSGRILVVRNKGLGIPNTDVLGVVATHAKVEIWENELLSVLMKIAYKVNLGDFIDIEWNDVYPSAEELRPINGLRAYDWQKVFEYWNKRKVSLVYDGVATMLLMGNDGIMMGFVRKSDWATELLAYLRNGYAMRNTKPK